MTIPTLNKLDLSLKQNISNKYNQHLEFLAKAYIHNKSLHNIP